MVILHVHKYGKTKKVTRKFKSGGLHERHIVAKSVVFRFKVKYFHYNWRNTLTMHISNLITVEISLLIKSQFTKNAPPESMHIRTCPITDSCTFSKVPVSCRRSDRHQNCTAEVSLHFQMKWIHLAVHVSPQIYNLRTKINTLLGCTLKAKCVCGQTDINLVWYEELIS